MDTNVDTKFNELPLPLEVIYVKKEPEETEISISSVKKNVTFIKDEWNSFARNNLNEKSPLAEIKEELGQDTISEEIDIKPELEIRLETENHQLSYGARTHFVCHQCDYKSARRFNFKRHQLTHLKEQPIQGKRFTCDHCDYKCYRRYYLTSHQLTHLKAKRFACHRCGYTSARNSDLKKHLLTHLTEKPAQEKRFVCDHCDYKCVRKSDLNRHQLIHLKEKPLTCDQCDYKSVRAFDLKNHQLTHLEEKPFGCNQCDYKSARRSNLNSHRLVHLK